MSTFAQLSAEPPSPALVNLAYQRAAYQSGAIDDNQCAHLATDGSELTYWESRPEAGRWIAVDLGRQTAVQRVRLHWGEGYPTAYQLEVSDDPVPASHWRTVYQTENGMGATGEIALERVVARQVRLVATRYATARGCVLREFEVLGPPGPPSRPPAPFAVRDDGALVMSGGSWRLQNAMFVDAEPKAISTPGFDDAAWLPAVVPGTVLTSYLRHGSIPDPRVGDQQTQVSESFFTNNDFWYRTAFIVPEADRGRRLWLAFDGINWQADVYCNGVFVGRIDRAFLRGRFDVSAVAHPGETNVLAVLVRRVAHPGAPTHKFLDHHYDNGGILGLDSPTFVSSIGWNWLPTIRGRNVGIYDEVRLEATGDASLIDPWVTSTLPLPDTTRADLTVRTGVANHTNQPLRIELVGRIGDIHFRYPLTLAPSETREVALNPRNVPELALRHPQLWWPNGYGAQPLYHLQLAAEQAGVVSDVRQVTFGIRQVDHEIVDGVLFLKVNGCRILCRGGNWGMEEGMLDCDAAGYDLRVSLHRDMHFVMIRNWVGMIGRQAFYDACDRYGLLVWDDFWLANPVDGPPPSDPALFLRCVRDKIRRVRSHASLALYCGRNEGLPPPELDAGMSAATAELDGTRLYLPQSAAGPVTGHGPYEVCDPEWYFANRGRTFHSEQGIVCVPPVESMRAMLPADRLWPINDLWAVHDYQTPRMPLYTRRIEDRYGPATGIEDYCRKAQMVNYESAKAMCESLQSHQGGGLLVWMTQPAWPSLICQLYDYYFEPTAAYFGTKTACQPVHVFWDCDAGVVKVANDTPAPVEGLSASLSVYDLAGRMLRHEEAGVAADATSATAIFSLPPRPAGAGTVFIKLQLKRANQVIDDNFYWTNGPGGSCRDLETLPKVALAADATQVTGAGTTRINVNLANPSSTVALMARLKVSRAASGTRVLPVFYEDNYVSLLPGEKRCVEMTFATADLAGEAPILSVEGWNIVAAQVELR
jgi:hypothetical protein